MKTAVALTILLVASVAAYAAYGPKSSCRPTGAGVEALFIEGAACPAPENELQVIGTDTAGVPIVAPATAP